MRRNRQTTLSIGTISSGTLRLEDLLPALLSELSALRLSRADRATVRTIARRSENIEDYYESDDPDGTSAADDYQDLVILADNYCPDYCYFGSTEGDGAEIGIWPISDLLRDNRQTSYDGEVWRGRENETPSAAVPRDYAYFLAVNDHGNATLYRRSGRTWTEVWAVV